jgi:hypothetical protein
MCFPGLWPRLTLTGRRVGSGCGKARRRSIPGRHPSLCSTQTAAHRGDVTGTRSSGANSRAFECQDVPVRKSGPVARSRLGILCKVLRRKTLQDYADMATRRMPAGHVAISAGGVRKARRAPGGPPPSPARRGQEQRGPVRLRASGADPGEIQERCLLSGAPGWPGSPPGQDPGCPRPVAPGWPARARCRACRYP